jgi:hypothetical protein
MKVTNPSQGKPLSGGSIIVTASGKPSPFRHCRDAHYYFQWLVYDPEQELLIVSISLCTPGFRKFITLTNR